MADDGAERPSGGGGGFSLTKRYGPLPAWAWGLLGGAGVYAVWRFRQARSAASTAATTSATGTDSQGVDFAPQIAVLQSEILQLQQGENGENISKPLPDVDTPNPGGPATDVDPTTTGGGSKKMPNVVGERANFAIGELKSGYGVRATTVPPRNPGQEYVVTGQTPRAGATVNPGTTAILRVRVDSSKRPAPRSKRTTGPTPGRARGQGSGPPVREPGRITTPMRRV